MNTFIQTVVVGLSVLSAYFLIRSVFVLTAKEIFRIINGSRKIHENSNRVFNLAEQNADIRVGFSLLVLSSVAQAYRIVTPLTIGDFDVSVGGFMAALVFWSFFLVIVFLVSSMTKNNARRALYAEVKEIPSIIYLEEYSDFLKSKQGLK